jgi:transcription initiation factor TFIID subunit 6
MATTNCDHYPTDRPLVTMSAPIQAASRGTLISLVEEHITSLVREANLVKRHAKRARINLTSSTGNDDGHGVVKRRLHADDLNMALQWRGSEKLYATGTIGSSMNGQESTQKVDLEEYLKSEMDLRPPQEVGLTVHWLAVDGNQPDIPQNPTQRTRRAVVSLDVHRVHDEEHDAETLNDATTAAADWDNNAGVQVRQLQSRLLSEELQLYFTRISSAVERGGATPAARQQQDAALASLARDAGLQELVPFLVKYVTQSIYQHVGNPEHCRTLVRMAQSILMNPHLHLELYVSRQVENPRVSKSPKSICPLTQRVCCLF